MKDLLERLARNTEWAMKQREGMVFDVPNAATESIGQGGRCLGFAGLGFTGATRDCAVCGGGMCWCEGGLRGGICCGVGECM